MLRSCVVMVLLTVAATAQQNSLTERSPAQSKIAAIEELLTLMKVDRTMQAIVLQFEAAFGPQLDKLIPPIQDLELRGKVLQDVQEFKNDMFAVVVERLQFSKLK